MSANVRVKTVDGHLLVQISLDSSGYHTPSVDMTPLEAEKFADAIRESARKARQANLKPQKFGEH